MSAATLLVTSMASLRRRARVVLVARYSVVALAIAVVAGAGARLVAGPDALVARPVPAGAALALVLAGAVLTAILRTPSARDVACIADDQLHLRERLRTAYECLDEDEAMAALVVEDASRCARDVHPAAIFPMRLPRAALTAIAVSALLMGIARWLPAVSIVPASRGIFVPGDRTRGVAAPSQTARAGTPARVDEKVAPVAAGRGSTPPTLPGSPAASETGRAREIERPSRGGLEAPRPQPGRAPVAERAARGDRPRSAGAAARGARLASGGADRPSGVAGPDPADARIRADLARFYPVYRQRAEAAVAHTKIPTGYRDYIRRYFLAIRP